MKIDDFLSLQTGFNLLSLRDLLAAREHFQLHLSHKPNVVATAIGRYRIRKSDPWPSKNHPEEDLSPLARDSNNCVRTLENSEVRPYSWPAIMVFVEKWVDVRDFKHPEDAIPPAVYMPNGQKVPICVIQVEKNELAPEEVTNYRYPKSMMGGGYPVICKVQEKEHMATVACLVSDGHRVYALTNRHVAGEAGTPISAVIGNNRVSIGKSSSLALGRVLFEKIYPGWPGSNIYVDLDVGLIDIDDLNRWTTQVYGIGEIGPLADLDVSNISLRLIGCPVMAHGAASGNMYGEICALYYQFKSVGGFDFVADVLIGPSGDKPLGTHPGDSGTLWLINNTFDKTSEKPRPIALQWGGQVFIDKEKKSSSYALATFLSTVCNAFDVTLLRDWHTGLPDYWGAVGHYSIANKACGIIQNQNLKALMQANLERISFNLPDINKKNLAGLSKRDFVPLADVPDLVWKIGPYRRGGQTAPEHANHFADMDRELDPPLPEGSTLLEICRNKPQNVSVDIWQRYYDAVQAQYPNEEESRGILPFRVWQIYNAMVRAVRNGDVAAYVCAAGILAHYVGDACQPLHISYRFNGDPDNTVSGTMTDRSTGRKVQGQVPSGHGVHSAYENYMVERHTTAISQGIDIQLSQGIFPPLVEGGQSAAFAVVEMMQKTFDTIPPSKILDEFISVQDEKPAVRADSLWEQLGDDTIKVMANGCFCLAQLWESAWVEGNGDENITSLVAIDEDVLAALYQNRNFLKSHTLNTISSALEERTAEREVEEEVDA